MKTDEMNVLIVDDSRTMRKIIMDHLDELVLKVKRVLNVE